jgi:TonB family protein
MKLKSYATISSLAIVLLIGVQIIAASKSTKTLVDEPAVITAAAPTYPPIARAAQASGNVSVEVTVKADGTVGSAKAVSGHPLLRAAGEEAAKRWRFVSSEAVGKRTASLVFSFTLMPRCSPVSDVTPLFYPPNKVEVRSEKPPIICDDCPPAEQERLRCKNP